MTDLKNQLIAKDHTHYDFFQDATALRIIPKQVHLNQDPPVHELATRCQLNREKYQLTWSVAAQNSNYVQRFELLVFFTNYSEPDIRFDLRTTPRKSIAFEMPDSKYLFVVLRICSKCIVTIHTLYVNLARDCLLGVDPLMHDWDLQTAARALKQQRLIVNQINAMSSLWCWEDIQKQFTTLQMLWRKAFPVLDGTAIDANNQRQTVKSRWTYPTLIATSSASMFVELVYEDSGWLLMINSKKIAPNFVHVQYLIWCLPDREIKIALQRDVLPTRNEERVTIALEGSALASTPAHFWLGYNMITNVPFCNLWTIPSRVDFVNANDLLVVFKQIELVFADNALFQEKMA